MNNESKVKLIKVWGDVVDIASMSKSMLIASITTMAGYFLAPANNRPAQLLLGLMGALLGTMINSWLFRPKRVVTTKEESNES